MTCSPLFKVRTIVYDGDADYILNFNGVEAMVMIYSFVMNINSLIATKVDALQTQFTTQFHATSFLNYTVNGQSTGVFKNAGTFSYVCFFPCPTVYDPLTVPRFEYLAQVMKFQLINSERSARDKLPCKCSHRSWRINPLLPRKALGLQTALR